MPASAAAACETRSPPRPSSSRTPTPPSPSCWMRWRRCRRCSSTLGIGVGPAPCVGLVEFLRHTRDAWTPVTVHTSLRVEGRTGDRAAVVYLPCERGRPQRGPYRPARSGACPVRTCDRFALQDGHTPRPLHEKATRSASLVTPRQGTRSRQAPTKLRQARSGSAKQWLRFPRPPSAPAAPGALPALGTGGSGSRAGERHPAGRS